MPLDFPTPLSLNQVYSLGGKSWKWNGAAWETYNGNVGITGPTGPTGPTGIQGPTGPTGETPTDYVSSFNGITGAVQGVYSVSGLTGAVGITGGPDILVTVSGQTLSINYIGSVINGGTFA